jgi:hypothetical protein
MPLPLSVAIVCKNNQATIGRTLESVAGLAQEIVAVDSGSTDATIAMLEAAGARVIRSPWLGHVRTKQLALEACEGEWVLSVDSDESLLPPLREAVESALPRAGEGVLGFEVNRKVFYRDRPLNHVWQPEWRLRLVRRGRAGWRGLDPHDVLAPLDGAPGRVDRLAGDLRHDSVGTFAEFLAKQAVHARTMAQSMHREGRRGSRWRAITSPPGAFLKQFIVKQGWRDGWPGFLAAGSTAAGALIKHLILIELSRTPQEPPQR